MNKNATEYFASLEDPNELADAIKNKIREYRQWCSGRGLMVLWSTKLKNYYGMSQAGNSSQTVNAGGSEGELSLVKVNDLHALIQEQLVVVTSQRPAGQARAINSDTQSLKAARVASAIAEYYMTQADFESKFVNCAEAALLCDEGYIELFWDKSAGDPIAVDPESGLPEMSGDVTLNVHPAWNVARDPGMIVETNQWYIISKRANKWDLANQYPKFSDYIKTLTDDSSDLPDVALNVIPDGSDVIFTHLLVHDRTPACPEGRYSLLVGDKVVLDTALPFKPFPVERMSPSDVIDGCMGYCPANDIMGMEQITDGLHSIITSNEITLGGQNLIGSTGMDLKIQDLAKGLRFFEVLPETIDHLRALELCKTPPEIFNYIGLLSQKKERAVGSVQSSLAAQASQGASGNSMALIQSQAISFNSGTQRSYFKLLSASMTKLIEILRSYADTPRVARIVGKTNSLALKEFKYTGQDLNSVSSIVYEMINPIAQTQGGRMTFAQDLIKAGMIKSPKQYIQVATTGQVDAMIQDDEADGLLILQENEWLVEGKPFKAIITQNHADHIKSHTSQITLEAQVSDPGMVERTLSHIQEHIDVWQQASMSNPGILIATGQQPLPPPMPPPGMMGPGGPMPGGPPPPSAPQGMGQLVGHGGAPAEQKALGVKPPELPNIAGTKEKPVIPGVTQ